MVLTRFLPYDRSFADADRAEFERRVRALQDRAPRKSNASTEAWWDLSPFAKRNEATPLSALPAEKAPLYLRRPDVHYWFERLYAPLDRALRGPP